MGRDWQQQMRANEPRQRSRKFPPLEFSRIHGWDIIGKLYLLSTSVTYRKENEQDHSPEGMERWAQKELETSGIVRDVRLSDLSGLSLSLPVASEWTTKRGERIFLECNGF
jgi:hypothetical protein